MKYFCFCLLLLAICNTTCNGSGQISNVAKGKKTYQSSTFSKNYPASKAVNSNQNDFSATTFETSPYWLVDLGNYYTIHSIVIVNRHDCCGERLRDLTVWVGRSLGKLRYCAHFTGPGVKGQIVIFKCPEGTGGRYVKLQITKGQHNLLQLAEVQVNAYDDV